VGPLQERELGGLEADIGETDATRFELATKLLGELLGFEAERPAAQADPDGAWRDGSSLWLLFEAKTEELPGGEISATEIRQANSHINCVLHHYARPEPEHAITLLITPKRRIADNAAGLPDEHLYLLDPAVLREIADDTIAAQREMAGEMVGLSDTQLVERMAARFVAAKLTTSDLIDRLTVVSMLGLDH
jgi:hypothetical protein